MSTIDNLLEELNECTISREDNLKHDNARIQYQLRNNIFTDYEEFIWIIGDYYNFHFQSVYNCGPLPQSKAQEKAKRAVEQFYRRNNGDRSHGRCEARTGWSRNKRWYDFAGRGISY